jgi:hypothetical protein
MRAIMMVFTCFTGLLVPGIWVVSFILARRSGRGLPALLSSRSHPEWLSVPETMAQYGDELSFPPEGG